MDIRRLPGTSPSAGSQAGSPDRQAREHGDAQRQRLLQVDLRHIDEARGTNVVELGVDLSEFYTSVEWDILEVPAVR